MFFLHAFLFILFGISVIAAPVHTPASGKGILLKPSDCGFWQKEHEKEVSRTPTLIRISMYSLTSQDVLRIDENHGKLTLELYKLKALAKGANAEPEHVFITHGNKDHLLLDPKENADLVVSNQWVRLPWVSVVIEFGNPLTVSYIFYRNISPLSTGRARKCCPVMMPTSASKWKKIVLST